MRERIALREVGMRSKRQTDERGAHQRHDCRGARERQGDAGAADQMRHGMSLSDGGADAPVLGNRKLAPRFQSERRAEFRPVYG
jgi:hypothetical protein